ncbi:MAG: DUF3108 domain-containing protein [Luteolibacter sp.]
MKRWLPRLSLLAFLFEASFSIASAQSAPSWAKDLTSPAPGPFSVPASPLALDYQLSWQGTMNAGNLKMEFAPPDAKKPGQYVVRSSANSTGAAAALFPYQHHFWSESQPKSLKPALFQATEIDRKESTTTTVQFTDSKVTSHETSKTLSSGKISTKDRSFAFAPVYDIFTAMLHVRSQKLDQGDAVCIVIQPFDQPYLFRAKSLGNEDYEGKKSIKLSVTLQKINRRTLALEPYKKLKGPATLWLSNDEDRIPLSFTASTFIGQVRANLTHRSKL